MPIPLPVVKVWKPGNTQWELAALPITSPDSLNAELRHLDFGSWSMDLPSAHPAVAELARGDAYFERLVTIDWQDRFTMTGLVADRERSRSADDDVFTVGGPGALAFLNWPLAWPVPGAGLGAQGTAVADVYPATADAPAEDVVAYFIAATLSRWVGASSTVVPVVDASQHRGSPLRGRARMRKLWQVVHPLARLGRIGISVGLVETSATRADLRVGFYEPADRTRQAQLSEDIGVLRSWDSTQGAPDVNRAIVGDAGSGTGRTFVSRTSGPGASWGGRVEDFVNADDTFDPVELNQRGDAVLTDGAAQAAFTLEAADTALVRFGVDYNLGDLVTVRVGAATATDHVNAVTLTVDSSGVIESPVVGDPNKPDPLFRLGSLIRSTRHTVDRSESKG